MWVYKYDFTTPHWVTVPPWTDHFPEGENRLVPLSSAVLTVLCSCSGQDRSDIFRPGLFNLCRCGSGLASVLIWNSILRKSKKKKKKYRKREKRHTNIDFGTLTKTSLWFGLEKNTVFFLDRLSLVKSQLTSLESTLCNTQRGCQLDKSENRSRVTSVPLCRSWYSLRFMTNEWGMTYFHNQESLSFCKVTVWYVIESESNTRLLFFKTNNEKYYLVKLQLFLFI